MDGADALERQLHEYRDRMTHLKSLVGRLPSDMTATAMSSINPENQVRTALRDILAHRLWIKREGATATIEGGESAAASTGRVAAAGGVVGIIFLVIVVLMVYRPGS